MMENLEALGYLRELRNYYNDINNERKYGYSKAITSVANYKGNLIEDLKSGVKVPGIASGITSKLLKLDSGIIPEELTEARNHRCAMKTDNSVNPHKHYTFRDIVAENVKDTFGEFCKTFNCRYELLGSYRRGNLDCGDADVLIISNDDVSDELIDYLSNLKNEYGQFLFTLTSKGSSKLKLYNNFDKFETDVRFCKEDEVGTFELHMTGSGFFNQAMREVAKNKGLLLNEYGVFHKDKSMLSKFTNEEDVFSYLGLKFVEPNKRIDADSLIYLAK